MHLENIHRGCAVGRVNLSQENTCRGQRSPNTQAQLTPVDQGTARLIHLSDTGSGEKHRFKSFSNWKCLMKGSCIRTNNLMYSKTAFHGHWYELLGLLPWVISKSRWASCLNLFLGESRVSVLLHTVCLCLDAVKVRSTSTPALTVLYSSTLACRENVPLFSSSTGSDRLKVSRTLNRPAEKSRDSY